MHHTIGEYGDNFYYYDWRVEDQFYRFRYYRHTPRYTKITSELEVRITRFNQARPTSYIWDDDIEKMYFKDNVMNQYDDLYVRERLLQDAMGFLAEMVLW